MKKLLAMVLALVMTLSLAVSANAFKDDKSISDNYAEAVAVLNGMGVFKGYEDNSFKPQGDITRAEVSAIVYRVYTQDVKDAKASMYATYNKFSDMAGAGWAQGYIGYCANAELVKGYPDGTFKPSGKVTGYEVLAMILRAVGYDKNGEFSGADWALHVAQTAQQAGVLKNVKGIDLNAPATRELVAELLFRAIADASTVNYTPAFGYVTDKVLKLDESTLGYKNFKLVGTASSDDWGRPGTKWTYNVGDKETLVVDKPVVSYTTKVDECDIAKDLGITKSKAIEAAYIDGDSQTVTTTVVTTDRNGKIDPKATTSLVGAQGRLTEVYDMGTAGYRFVEINTYLAKVDKVTAATTDRNGHTTNATVDLTVYLTNSTGVKFTKVEAEGFTVDQYVLVTVLNPEDYNAIAAKNKASVESVEAATVTPMGQLKTWTYAYGTTAATTTVAATTYNDADKFYVGNIKSASNDSYDTIVDTYGNLIGMVASNVNYAVVEKIEWSHGGNYQVAVGKAVANLVLADGTKVTDAVIASVNRAVTSNFGDSDGVVRSAFVSDSYVNNTAYYDQIFTYSVNADGAYELVPFCKAPGTATDNHNKADMSIKNGISGTITTDDNKTVVYNNNTMFLVKNVNAATVYDQHSYTAYKGINEVPSMSIKDGNLCVVHDDTYATLVVVNNYELAGNTFVAYVPAQDGKFMGYNDSGVYYAYEVFKLGETKATTVYSKSDKAFEVGSEGAVTGFYSVKLDGDGYVLAVKDTNNGVIGTDSVRFLGVAKDGWYATARVYADGNSKVDDLYWSLSYAKSNDNESLITTAKASKDTLYVYGSKTAQFFDVNTTIWATAADGKTTYKTTVTANADKTVEVGDQVVVAYDKDKNASYVYVLKDETNTVTTPDKDPSLKLEQKGGAAQVVATYSTGSYATDVTIHYYYRQHGVAGADWNEFAVGTMSHHFDANAAAKSFDARTLPNAGGNATFDVMVKAICTVASDDYAVGDTVAESNIVEGVIA